MAVIAETPNNLVISRGVARALAAGGAVVALESTVIAHGLPAPHNLEAARACEAAVRAGGAEPATVAVLGGRPVVGLDGDQLAEVASRDGVAKVNLANLARVCHRGEWGATTVAASLHLAHRAGVRVFATGGIGGVHRGAGESFDISADLAALARYPLIAVSAGAKAILDLPKTLEALETLGVPVIGYGTDELPAFYSRHSGLRLETRAESAAEVAGLARAHWGLGGAGAVLVVAPVPAADEVPAAEVGAAIDEALTAAVGARVTGKDVTPFLLARVAGRTGGRALRANLALLANNARIAGEIARALAG
ncbi:MAG TPA: pseudouridine-5'-phosphate glycosidase [Blastocatellia bacterium]|nr:pseudouridine-5'-phosphate glycosidase [Blastocatellia bacterium]